MKPMTVKQVSELTGVSVRTLQYYDSIGLLSPETRTDAGYRLYTEDQLARLQEILLFRELEFPLKDIKRIMTSTNYDRQLALRQQIELLTRKRKHLETLIAYANELLLAGHSETGGGSQMDFTAFDKSKLEEYAKRAKEQYGDTDAWKESEEKAAGRTPDEDASLADGMMAIFSEFGARKDGDPAASEAQALVKKLQSFITEHFYPCTPEILKGLGAMYTADPEFTENIDRAGGTGTAAFAAAAIERYVK